MSEIMLAPRHSPRMPPMLEMKLTLAEKNMRHVMIINVKMPLLPSDVSVLDDELAVGLLDEDVDHGGVLPHVAEDGLLEPVDPLLVLPEPDLGPGVGLAAPGLRHRPDLRTQARVPPLQGLCQRGVSTGYRGEFSE